MRRDHETFRMASAANLSLAARRALVCWRRDMTREAAQGGALRRACKWVEPLIGMFVTLRNEPLFGRCIAELVGDPSAGNEVDKAARHARPNSVAKPRVEPRLVERTLVEPGLYDTRTTRTQPPGAAERRAARAKPPVSETGRKRRPHQPGISDAVGRSSGDAHNADANPGQARQRRSAELTGLPQRASRELLESCAGAERQGHWRHGEPEASANTPAATHSPRSSPATRPETKRGVPAHDLHKAGRRRAGEPTGSRQPQASTGRRADFTPVSEPVGVFHSPAESPAEAYARRLVRRAATSIPHLRASAEGETHACERLVEQWSTTLEGETVSGDWLRGLITRESNATGVRQSDGRLRQSSPPASHRHPGLTQSLEEGSLTGANYIAEASPSSRQRREGHSLNSPGDSFGDSSGAVGGPFGDERGHRGGAENLSAAEQIAPPSLATSLPALSPLASPQATVAGVLPLASETARLGAGEEAKSSEDLDALAAKIKFILDEQARRHGIDV